tara:strand:- start:125 stop:343 length:219 start_codon:yes stop_codon:yes gene_type:complete
MAISKTFLMLIDYSFRFPCLGNGMTPSAFPRSQAQAIHAAYLPTLKSSAGSTTRIEGIFGRIGKGVPIKNIQ